MKKIIFGAMFVMLLSGAAFAEEAAQTQSLDALKQKAMAAKQSFGTQAGQKAAEFKQTGQNAYNNINEQAQKSAAEVKKTSQDSAKLLEDQFHKTFADIQAAWNKMFADWNKQFEDFKAQLISGQKKAA